MTNINDPEGFFLLGIGILSILCSLFVFWNVSQSKIRTLSSRLLVLLTAASALLSFSKLPFIFPSANDCVFAESLFWYSSMQVGVITNVLLYSTSKLLFSMIHPDAVNILSTRKRDLFLIIYVCPVLPLGVPLFTTSFSTNHYWCATDRDSLSGHISSYVLSLILFSCNIYAIYLMKQMHTNFQLLEKEFRAAFRFNVLRGPVLYSIISLLVYLVANILLFISLFTRSSHNRKEG